VLSYGASIVTHWAPVRCRQDAYSCHYSLGTFIPPPFLATHSFLSIKWRFQDNGGGGIAWESQETSGEGEGGLVPLLMAGTRKTARRAAASLLPSLSLLAVDWLWVSQCCTDAVMWWLFCDRRRDWSGGERQTVIHESPKAAPPTHQLGLRQQTVLLKKIVLSYYSCTGGTLWHLQKFFNIS
jgi:hypothetical protein